MTSLILQNSGKDRIYIVNYTLSRCKTSKKVIFFCVNFINIEFSWALKELFALWSIFLINCQISSRNSLWFRQSSHRKLKIAKSFSSGSPRKFVLSTSKRIKPPLSLRFGDSSFFPRGWHERVAWTPLFHYNTRNRGPRRAICGRYCPRRRKIKP